MKRKKKFKPLLYYLFKLLSKSKRSELIKSLVRRKTGSYALDLPDDLTASKNILFVLPEDPLEALHQVVNIISIINFLMQKNTVHIIFLCENKIAPYFKNIHGIQKMVTYESDQRYLFSQEFALIRKELQKEYVDLCLFLERKPDLSLLHLIGTIRAKVRVTYDGVSEFPFFNLHVKTSNQQLYRPRQNCVMAKNLGAKIEHKLQWSVSKEVITEITLMLKGSGITDDVWFAGIDSQYFFETFGSAWTQTLIKKLTETADKTWYLYTEDIQKPAFLTWLKSLNLPVFSDLTPSRQAALLYKSNFVITGKTALFELANLLHKPVLGLFEVKELPIHCKITATSMGISYTKKPDEQTITKICEQVGSLKTEKVL